MHIEFHGAAQCVTGSKHLIVLENGKKLLLDCGMFQGMGKDTLALNSNLGFDAATVSYVILSHAHIDHCGLLPKLVRDGFTGNIYCTPATAALIKLMLADSAHIQASDIKFLNKKRKLKGQAPVEPLYTMDDAEKTLELIVEVDYAHATSIDEDISFEFKEAGHILGSASVHVAIVEKSETKRITFSGDVGRYNDAILNAPESFPQADYVIIESTYGNSLHEEFSGTSVALLKNIIETCVHKKGKLIIPAFSMGRTQELLFALNEMQLEGKLPKVKYYVDSPLSVKITAVSQLFKSTFNDDVQDVMKTDEDPFAFDGLHYINTKEESKALNATQEPCVIISASGMAEAGRVKHHIMNNIADAKNTILLVGYCSPQGLGGRLKAGEKQVRIFGDWFDVQAEVQTMRSMSAHGDYDDLLKFLDCQNKTLLKKVFLVHGEHDVQQDFAQKLHDNGFASVYIPKLHENIEL
jgi:metallo-beta-lactamase family protein